MTQDLTDVSFMIPVKIDSEDRVNNLNFVTMYLRENFNTKIIIAEQDTTGLIPHIVSKTLYDYYILYKTDNIFFHKTKLINAMIKYADTPIVAMHDSDVLCDPDQYTAAAASVRENKTDYAYPFNGRVINVPKKNIPSILQTMQFKPPRARIANTSKALAPGGCVIYNRAKFIAAGMMNEHFVAYGPEDGEQDERLERLGYRKTRVGKPLYHLDHIRTHNSNDTHAFASQNWSEMKKIRQMNLEQLKKYISDWPWTKF